MPENLAREITASLDEVHLLARDDEYETAVAVIVIKLAEANTARDKRDAEAKKMLAWALDTVRTAYDELRGTAVRSNAVDAARYCARDCVGHIEDALALLGGGE